MRHGGTPHERVRGGGLLGPDGSAGRVRRAACLVASLVALTASQALARAPAAFGMRIRSSPAPTRSAHQGCPLALLLTHMLVLLLHVVPGRQVLPARTQLRPRGGAGGGGGPRLTTAGRCAGGPRGGGRAAGAAGDQRPHLPGAGGAGGPQRDCWTEMPSMCVFAACQW